MVVEHYVLIALLFMGCRCLRIVSFEGPALLLPGDSAYLRCLFELGEDSLYSVKWYKDAVEFFRYHPQLQPQFMAFHAPGINVDLTRSGRSTVYLRNVSANTEGRFTCQVSADEPHFGCVQAHKDVAVHVPPESGPEIEEGPVEQGVNLTALCTVPKSRPAANISWHLNDGTLALPSGAHSSLEVTRHQDGLESSTSRLDIPVGSVPESILLRVQCEAVIPDLVTAVSRELVLRPPQLQPRMVDTGKAERASSVRVSPSTFSLFVIAAAMLIWTEHGK